MSIQIKYKKRNNIRKNMTNYNKIININNTFEFNLYTFIINI